MKKVIIGRIKEFKTNEEAIKAITSENMKEYYGNHYSLIWERFVKEFPDQEYEFEHSEYKKCYICRTSVVLESGRDSGGYYIDEGWIEEGVKGLEGAVKLI